MSSPYVIGPTVAEYTGSATKRYFYGLKVSEDGTLYLGRADISSGTDDLQLFLELPPDEIAEMLDIPGEDYFEGQDANHEVVSTALNYVQWRWDARLISYYIDDDGQFVASIGQDRSYPLDV
jgi:hypothetical protein